VWPRFFVAPSARKRGKVDHRHLDGKKSVWHFVSIDQLLDDCIAEMERRVE